MSAHRDMETQALAGLENKALGPDENKTAAAQPVSIVLRQHVTIDGREYGPGMTAEVSRVDAALLVGEFRATYA